MKIHWWCANSPKLVSEIIYINFSEASKRFGFLDTSFWRLTLTYCLEKICISKAKIIGQMSINNWFNDIYESFSIRILIQKRIRIRRAGCAVYDILITSAIFYNRPLIFWAYLSFDPEYRIKQIRSKLLIRFLFSFDSFVK